MTRAALTLFSGCFLLRRRRYALALVISLPFLRAERMVEGPGLMCVRRLAEEGAPAPPTSFKSARHTRRWTRSRNLSTEFCVPRGIELLYHPTVTSRALSLPPSNRSSLSRNGYGNRKPEGVRMSEGMPLDELALRVLIAAETLSTAIPP
jgi:hypothetical protein